MLLPAEVKKAFFNLIKKKKLRLNAVIIEVAC